MKNYLFRPFQNDNEKEDVFKEYQDNHKHLDNSQVIGFICRLESTYDVIISKLQADNVELHQEAEEIAEGNKEYFDQVMELKADNKRLNDKDGLYDEVKELQAEYDELQAEIKLDEGVILARNKEVDDLKAENKRLKNGFGHGVLVELEQVDSLKDEIKELQAENIKLSSECWCGGNNDVKAELNALREQELDLIRDKDDLKADNDKLKADKHNLKANGDLDWAEIRQLKAENKDLTSACNMLREDNKSVEVECARLMKQVGSNRCNSSSTHTHTISKEIAEYMSHNEGCDGARMFLIPRDEFKNDEYNNTIYWDDGME